VQAPIWFRSQPLFTVGQILHHSFLVAYYLSPGRPPWSLHLNHTARSMTTEPQRFKVCTLPQPGRLLVRLSRNTVATRIVHTFQAVVTHCIEPAACTVPVTMLDLYFYAFPKVREVAGATSRSTKVSTQCIERHPDKGTENDFILKALGVQSAKLDLHSYKPHP